MLRTKNTSTWFAIVLAIGLHGVPAHAQLARTHVSGVNGNDANDCNRLTPCRTFQKAHDSTLAAGEITVLDPGGYGALTITKAISIINDGVGEAGTLVSGGLAGITINAGPSDAVSLRGLTVKGIGFGGGNGIVFNSGKSLTIENCVVRSLTGDGVVTGFGIQFIPSTGSTLAVSNTLVADNGTSGILVRPIISLDSVRAVFNRVEAYNNGGDGIAVSRFGPGGPVNVTVTDSISAQNGTGFAVSSPIGTPSLMVVRSVAANNGTGLAVTGVSATMRIGQSTVTGNTVSASLQLGGVLLSYGNNNIDGNGDGGVAPPTIATK